MAAPRSSARRLAPAAAIVGLVLFGIACGKSKAGPTAPSPSPTPSPTPPTVWTTEGTRLQRSDFSLPSDVQGIADVSAAVLSDGRIRLYVAAVPPFPSGILSAVSSDGLSFSVEGGLRVASVGFPRAVSLDGGGWRLFFQVFEGGAAGIGSAVSTDGLTFTREAGLRIKASDVGATSQVTGPGIYKLAQGGYRMYVSESPGQGLPTARHVHSATSSDMLTWSVESGTRIGPGATVSGSAEHPFPLSNSDGSVTLFYCRSPLGAASAQGVYMSTSTNGIDFATETYTGIAGCDPDVVRLSSGVYRMYYGDATPTTGGYILSARGAASLVPFTYEVMPSPPWFGPNRPVESPNVPGRTGDINMPAGEDQRRPPPKQRLESCAGCDMEPEF